MIDDLLHRLEGVRETGKDRWLAKCPAHDDRSPSLSIRETGGGVVLLKCFAGCGAADVVAAVGLEFRDLFPEIKSAVLRFCSGRRPPRIPAGDRLLLIEHETTVVAILAADFLKQRKFDEGDWQRLAQAVERIGKVQNHGR